jgi:putative ABC transport system permease protein
MFRYYLLLGFRSLRRNPVLTVLMVLTLAVGVSASMTTLTLLHGMSGDPIPHKSSVLFVPLLDNRPTDGPLDDSDDPPEQLAYGDAMRLWELAKGARQTPILGVAPAIDAGRKDLPPFFGDGVAAGRDFFTMFDVPFLYGQAWSVADDRDAAQVVVISRSLSEKVFGAGVNPVGKSLRISDVGYTVSGVIDTWNPLPKYYRLVGSRSFGDHEDVFLPFRTAIAREMDINGNINCSGPSPEPGFKGLMASECVWVQLWVELESASARKAYADFLGAYVGEQKKLGRLPRPVNNRLHDVRQWLDAQAVVDDDTKTSAWLAFGFLLVCLVNTVGLLLAKFSARPGDIGVRRALGATRREVFQQHLVEAGVIGLIGAAVGVALTFGSLAFIRSFDESTEMIARMDLPMMAIAIVLSVAASLVAGLLPTWRACQVVPALQLKSQ